MMVFYLNPPATHTTKLSPIEVTPKYNRNRFLLHGDMHRIILKTRDYLSHRFTTTRLNNPHPPPLLLLSLFIYLRLRQLAFRPSLRTSTTAPKKRCGSPYRLDTTPFFRCARNCALGLTASFLAEENRRELGLEKPPPNPLMAYGRPKAITQPRLACPTTPPKNKPWLCEAVFAQDAQ